MGWTKPLIEFIFSGAATDSIKLLPNSDNVLHCSICVKWNMECFVSVRIGGGVCEATCELYEVPDSNLINIYMQVKPLQTTRPCTEICKMVSGVGSPFC